MLSKRDIRYLRRENFKLQLEIKKLVKKNEELVTDNNYFFKFIDLILKEPEEPPRRYIKLFH